MKSGGGSSPASASPACIYSQMSNNRTADQHQAHLTPGDISPAHTVLKVESSLLIGQMKNSDP